MNDKNLEYWLELANKATQTVGWYPHMEEVRGPFVRWFKCTEVKPEYKQHVATTENDCNFAAAAMNNFVPLIKEVQDLKEKVKQLIDELVEEHGYDREDFE